MLMVPPAVNTPHAMALSRVELADTDTNWKCSFLLGTVLALAAVDTGARDHRGEGKRARCRAQESAHGTPCY